MAQKRELFRVGIDRTGRIQRGAETVPCQVVDLTEKGFQLRVEGTFHVGEALDLEFVLNEPRPVLCTIQVTHVRPPYVGALIARISPEHQAQLSRFIEELNALNMTGF
jgi:hypothetical protein